MHFVWAGQINKSATISMALSVHIISECVVFPYNLWKFA